jgi:PadR family transcriptional regulator, regulatory protein AphA
MSNDRLTPTSYLILGMLAREGPSTPYDLERDVADTLGHFWSFPHALLYKEPPRLEALGLVTETRETEGRRRRVLAITPAGLATLTMWLDRPAGAHTELRDPGLLQLFFMDLASDEARWRLAQAQLTIHRAKLAAYEADAPRRRARRSASGLRTMEHWRGATLPMGLLYERAAVEFWASVADNAAGLDAPAEAQASEAD